MIRAFVGIRLDGRVVRAIAAAIEELKPKLHGIRWVAPEAFHLTLKFLGPISEEKIEPISSALGRSAKLFSRFTINAKGLGVFPETGRPRVLWVGLEARGLEALASRVESELEPLGFDREKRSFTPHLTVGRWRRPEGGLAALRTELERWRSREFGVSTVEDIVLFQSVLTRSGAVYTPIRIFELNGEVE
ncbi:MAG TPA: RNA 2',3'-cyclic phosphodiesterase [candidate division Zixibacteria bacterium]|nr:RNA 2',3'-cyclic phosphodiesterase [candidate division Zixibacteria bacterium]